jgi:hypothetical protein
MRRSGKVAGINRDQGMVAIATDDDGYTIIEIVTGCAIDVGDAIAWEDSYHIGPSIYENLTKGSRDGVFVKNHTVSEFELDQQMLR